MKKLFSLLTIVFIIVFSSTCYAYDGTLDGEYGGYLEYTMNSTPCGSVFANVDYYNYSNIKGIETCGSAIMAFSDDGESFKVIMAVVDGVSIHVVDNPDTYFLSAGGDIPVFDITYENHIKTVSGQWNLQYKLLNMIMDNFAEMLCLFLPIC